MGGRQALVGALMDRDPHDKIRRRLTDSIAFASHKAVVYVLVTDLRDAPDKTLIELLSPTDAVVEEFMIRGARVPGAQLRYRQRVLLADLIATVS